MKMRSKNRVQVTGRCPLCNQASQVGFEFGSPSPHVLEGQCDRCGYVRIMEDAAVEANTQYLRIRCIVKTDRTSAHERVDSVGEVKPDGSPWELTQDLEVIGLT
jgi:hypothetical protein